MRSRCLPNSSGILTDNPVTLPPGRARLATRPAADRVRHAAAKTIGNDRGRLPSPQRQARSRGNEDNIDLQPDKLGGYLGEPLSTTFRPTIFDR